MESQKTNQGKFDEETIKRKTKELYDRAMKKKLIQAPVETVENNIQKIRKHRETLKENPRWGSNGSCEICSGAVYIRPRDEGSLALENGDDSFTRICHECTEKCGDCIFCKNKEACCNCPHVMANIIDYGFQMGPFYICSKEECIQAYNDSHCEGGLCCHSIRCECGKLFCRYENKVWRCEGCIEEFGDEPCEGY